MRFSVIIPLALFALCVLAGCGGGGAGGGGTGANPPNPQPPEEIAPDGALVGDADLRMHIVEYPFELTVSSGNGNVILRSADSAISYALANQTNIAQTDGIWWDWTDEFTQFWRHPRQVVRVTKADARHASVFLSEAVGGQEQVRVDLAVDAGGVAKVEVAAINPAICNRLQVCWRDRPADRYYGTGMRWGGVEYKGKKLRNWCEEKGIFGSHGEDTTYYPLPFYLNNHGYGVLLDTDRYATLDFNSDGYLPIDAVRILHNHHTSRFTIFHGPKPLQVLEKLTARTGRIPRMPPPWALGTWMAGNNNPERALFGGITGTARTRTIMDTVRANRIPASAIWIEDWWWGNILTNAWKLDRTAYPGYEQLRDDIHARGFKHLGYFLPYLDTRVPEFVEAANLGHLIKKPDGTTYTWSMTSGTFGYTVSQIDVTKPAARAWFLDRFMKQATGELGFDGWMQDFGEYTPPDAVFSDGSTGATMHNRYPHEWIKLAADHMAQEKPDGDYVLFPRSGTIGTTALGGVTVTGDHNANYAVGDGLPASMAALMSLGMSGGAPLGGTDIAAYYFWTDKELFMRFVELGAMQPIMRCHNGTIPFRHWRFDDDAETLQHFKKMAILHNRLFPYLYTLTAEAKDTGHPLVRHLMLHYPNDAEAVVCHDQYLLGDRLLVAPVLTQGATTRSVYLPEGRWWHWWSNTPFTGPGRVSVPAPFGEIPIFVKEGTILPLFEDDIDTLARENSPTLKGWDDVNANMVFRFYGAGADAMTLWDGTVVQASRVLGLEGSGAVSAGPGRNNRFEFIPTVPASVSALPTTPSPLGVLVPR